jgi:hypothetical protein
MCCHEIVTIATVGERSTTQRLEEKISLNVRTRKHRHCLQLIYSPLLQYLNFAMGIDQLYLIFGESKSSSKHFTLGLKIEHLGVLNGKL